MRDTYAEKLFDGRCPYTDEKCDNWNCQECKVEEEERHLFDDVYNESEVEV